MTEMRAKLRNLSRLAYGNGFTLWHYQADTVSEALQPDFFDDAVSIDAGDHVHVSAPNGGAVLCAGEDRMLVMCWAEEAG